jgi:orotate phosphoribosyltransferase
MAQVEGHAPAGAEVALVEDVSTTGNQVLAAARALEAEGCRVAVVVLAIDRGGAAALGAAGYPVRAVVEVRP